ncbi:MAG: membrane protein insertase YidC, partial [Pseudomonadota bacterium]
MDEQNRNLILAIVLSTAVFLGWTILFPPEPPATVETPEPGLPTAIDTPPAAVVGGTDALAADAEAATEEVARVPIETGRLSGSISLQGGRIDDLKLLDYRVTLEDDSPNVTLFSPVGQAEPHYALFGWVPGGDLSFDDVPSANTIWSQSGGTTLSPDTPVELSWDNGNGLLFKRLMEIDEDFLFTITQTVENTGEAAARLAPHNLIER